MVNSHLSVRPIVRIPCHSPYNDSNKRQCKASMRREVMLPLQGKHLLLQHIVFSGSFEFMVRLASEIVIGKTPLEVVMCKEIIVIIVARERNCYIIQLKFHLCSLLMPRR
jgi:hypothetical protein